MHKCVEISKDELQAGPLPRGHPAHLLQGSITQEHLLYASSIEISCYSKVHLVIVLGSDQVNGVDDI